MTEERCEAPVGPCCCQFHYNEYVRLRSELAEAKQFLRDNIDTRPHKYHSEAFNVRILRRDCPICQAQDFLARTKEKEKPPAEAFVV